MLCHVQQTVNRKRMVVWKRKNLHIWPLPHRHCFLISPPGVPGEFRTAGEFTPILPAMIRVIPALARQMRDLQAFEAGVGV